MTKAGPGKNLFFLLNNSVLFKLNNKSLINTIYTIIKEVFVEDLGTVDTNFFVVPYNVTPILR